MQSGHFVLWMLMPLYSSCHVFYVCIWRNLTAETSTQLFFFTMDTRLGKNKLFIDKIAEKVAH